MLQQLGRNKMEMLVTSSPESNDHGSAASHGRTYPSDCSGDSLSGWQSLQTQLSYQQPAFKRVNSAGQLEAMQGAEHGR